MASSPTTVIDEPKIEETAVEKPTHVQARERFVTTWDVLVGLLPALGFLPMLIVQGVRVAERPHMSFVPLVLLIVVGYSVWHMQGPSCKRRVRLWCAIAGLSIALLIYALAVWYFSPWLAHVACVGLFCAWALGRWGNSSWPHVAAVALLLATTLPWPGNADVNFQAWLHAHAGRYASAALDAFSVPNLLSAGVLRTEHSTLTLPNETTYGSVFALLALCGVIGLLRHRSFLHTVLLAVTTPLWYMVSSSLGLLICNYFQWSLEAGAQAAIFASAAVAVLLFDQFLGSMLLTAPVTEPDFELQFELSNRILCWPHADPLDEIPPDDPLERRVFEMMRKEKAEQAIVPETPWQTLPYARWSVGALAAMALLLGIAPGVLLARGDVISRAADFRPLTAEQFAQIVPVDFASEDGLPKQLGAWSERSARTVQATENNAAAIQWQYAWRGQVVVVHVAFPFATWSGEVTFAVDREWRRESESVLQTPNSDWTVALSQFVNPLGGKSYVVQTAMDDLLQPVSLASEERVDRLEGERVPIMSMLNPLRDEDRHSVYRITAQCESGGGLTQAELDEFHKSFEIFCQAIRDKLKPESLPALQ